MSRCGLRKLCFRLKCAIFMRYYAVNRTKFSAQLACRQETWFKCYFDIPLFCLKFLVLSLISYYYLLFPCYTLFSFFRIFIWIYSLYFILFRFIALHLHTTKLCAKFNLSHRVILYLVTLLFLISIACFGTGLDLSQPPAFWWLTVTSWRYRISLNSFLN